MLLLPLYLVLPALLIKLCLRWPALDKVGVVILCYLAGSCSQAVLVFVLPEHALNQLGATKDQLMSVVLVLAIPLLLMAMDLKRWLSLAPVTLKAMGSAMCAVLIAAFLAYFLWGPYIADPVASFGLTVGVYIGGTPNMAAVQQALQAPELLFLEIHTYDSLLSMAYLLFIMTIAQRVFLRFLPAFNTQTIEGDNLQDNESTASYLCLCRLTVWRQIWPALVVLLLIVALVVALAAVLPASQQMAVTMLLLSLAGLAASMNAKIRQVAGTYELGMYLILVFCTLVGSMLSVDLLERFNWGTLAFVATVMFGSLLLHALFSKLLGIDTDTFIITSVATICSPPMVPMIASVLRNRAMLLSGIGAGVIGYALGSLLAISLALMLNHLA